MKRVYIFVISFLLFSGCATIKKKEGKKESEKNFLYPLWREEIVKNNSDLTDEEKKAIINGKIPVGMEKKKVEKILGIPYGKYIPDSKMMEVWFYDDFFVGFDKDGNVVKFKIFTPVEKGEENEGKS